MRNWQSWWEERIAVHPEHILDTAHRDVLDWIVITVSIGDEVSFPSLSIFKLEKYLGLR